MPPKKRRNRSGKTSVCIEAEQDLERIRQSLKNRPRDLLLFDMATQTGIPARKWLHLKVQQLLELDPGDFLVLAAKGKRPTHKIVMNEVLYHSFQRFLKESKPDRRDYIFKSRKGAGPLHLSSVSRMVKGWLKENGIETAGSLLSLRKAREHLEGHTAIAMSRRPAGAHEKDYLQPIRVPTRQEMVYRELETAILSGRIFPGERIISEEVAQRLGVSQIPVREALRRLEAVGLITSRPNHGSTVTELSRENLEEILEIRIHLECLAGGKASLGRDGMLIDRLTRLHRQYAEARSSNNADLLLQINKKFHHTLYRGAGMPILLNMIEQLWDRVSPYYFILFRQSVKPNPVIGIKYHMEIINAVKRKDPKGVSKWIEADLTDSTCFVLKLFEASGPSGTLAVHSDHGFAGGKS